MQLSQFIIQDMPGILEEWEAFARSLPGTDSMDRKGLRDHAEQILRAIVRQMECSQTAREELAKSKGARDAGHGAASAAQEHGGGRLEEGFSMPEMVAEYRALRASVIRRWRNQQPVPEDALEQVTRFNEGIDQALTESVKRFSANLDRARELFMGALGHDLRGPLHVILAATQYLQKPELPQHKHEDMAKHVRESAERIHRMIDDLLDVAQTKLGGQLPINPRSTDAAEVCARVIAEMRALHADREFRLEASGDVTGVWDGGRIEQLLSNLVSNAAQHGDAHSAIVVSAKGGAEHLLLSVHNQGEPIPERVLGRIFEPLVRGEAPQSRGGVKGNIGLGLYIACAVARAHQGRIDVQSSRAAGTTFTVSLPKNAPSVA